ncbi:hypothetical protein AB0I28_16190 [Phytomonospora sp. NPDC050363]|uniref:hypothetical protein n=1 Tax=Phytomonospora sp. NPDC050363 TaxID=3155642 RepID=UPI0033C743F7
MKRRPIRTAILIVITLAVWAAAFKLSFPAEQARVDPNAGRHLPPIATGPGTHLVHDTGLDYTFTVPAGFAVHPESGDLLPESWLPAFARITRENTESPVDTDGLGDEELAASAEANPPGDSLPADRGVLETFELNGFRVVVAEWPLMRPGMLTYTAYHERSVITFTMIPPDPSYVYDPGVFPAAMDALLGSLEFD